MEAQEPDGWLIDAVLLPDGRNILDTVFAFDPGTEYAGIRVVVSDQAASFRGVSEVKPFPLSAGVMVVAFPEDRSLWRVYRNPRFAHVDDDGSFEITNIRPGQSYLVATCLWPCNTGPEGEGLKTLAGSATRIRVDRPGVFNIDLRRR